MKVKLSIFIALLFCYSLAIAQIKNSAKTINQTFELAREKNKPLFLVIDVAPSKQFATKNVSFDKALEKDILEDFVYYQTNRLDTSIRKIILKNKFRSYPAFVFFHPNEDIFLSDFGLSSTRTKYVNMLKKAKELSKEKSITELQKDVYNNPSNNEELKKLIESRQKNGITDNAELIEQFAKNLKLEDFKDYKTVLFVLSCGPYAYGNAYKLAYSNRKITDSIYKFEPLKTRVDMNNAIISNTLQNAIKTKNANQAHYAASFAKATYGKNINMGNRVYSSNMISYHKAVNDTTCYFRLAIPFYDRYYMTLSADSIKKGEEKRRISFAEKNFKKPNENAKVVTKSEFDSIRKQLPTTAEQHTTYMVLSENGNNTYATTLNNVAWSFYETGTRNINYLTKAMLWSRRSIELEPNAAYYDTLAHLLYRLGYETEAIKTQENAIAQAKIQKANFEHMQGELKKMKNKTL